MFLQILEDGRLTDSQGRTVSFKDTVIIMTSNAGVAEKAIHVGFNQSEAIQETNILQSLGSFFKPEFLNRFDSIIEFNSLEKNDLLQIIQLLLNELQDKLLAQDIHLEITEEVKEKLLEVGYHPNFGARPLRRAIQEQLEDQMADYILDHSEDKKLRAIMEDQAITIISQNE